MLRLIQPLRNVVDLNQNGTQNEEGKRCRKIQPNSLRFAHILEVGHFNQKMYQASGVLKRTDSNLDLYVYFVLARSLDTSTAFNLNDYLTPRYYTIAFQWDK